MPNNSTNTAPQPTVNYAWLDVLNNGVNTKQYYFFQIFVQSLTFFYNEIDPLEIDVNFYDVFIQLFLNHVYCLLLYYIVSFGHTKCTDYFFCIYICLMNLSFVQCHIILFSPFLLVTQVCYGVPYQK